MNAEVVDLVPVENTVTLFGSNDPNAVVVKATALSKPLANVIKDRKLFAVISGRKHVTVEGWTLLGTMLGVFPVVVWTKPIEGGWEARVEARTLSGDLVGAAESQCTHAEKTWKTRDDYALRSMAQTRATSKALRLPLGFVMAIAGYDSTPLEEMIDSSPPGDVPASGPQPSGTPSAATTSKGRTTSDDSPASGAAADARIGNEQAPRATEAAVGVPPPSAPLIEDLRDALQKLHPGKVVWRKREMDICKEHEVDSLEALFEKIGELEFQTITHNVLSKVKN